MEKVPTERIILLLLAAILITVLILWVLVRITKEMMRQFDLWVLQRARYLETHQHHHQHHQHNKLMAGAQKRKPNKKGKDDVYSGESQSSSSSGSESD